jgi:hypothetical protein
VPGETCLVPAAHEPCGTHWPAFALDEKVPGGHTVQTWSAFVVPACETYVPTAQMDHAWHAAASVLALKLPAAQVVHA